MSPPKYVLFWFWTDYIRSRIILVLVYPLSLSQVWRAVQSQGSQSHHLAAASIQFVPERVQRIKIRYSKDTPGCSGLLGLLFFHQGW